MLAKIIESSDKHTLAEVFCDSHNEEHCNSHCKGCTHFKKPKKTERFIVKNKINAKTGDLVELSLEEYARLKSSILLLLVPMLVFLVTAGIVSSLNIEAWLIFLISLASIAITLMVLGILLKNKTYYYISNVKGSSSDFDYNSNN